MVDLPTGPVYTAPLLDAIKRGRYEEAKKLLTEGAPVNERSGYSDETALISLAEHYPWHTKELVKSLLVRGADVEAETKHGMTALLTALQRGHGETAKILLEAGADITHATRYGRTPLHVAASAGNGEMVRYLLGKGAAADTADSYGTTPLGSAAYNGDTYTMEILIAAGANVNAVEQGGETPLMAALDDDDVKSMESDLDPEDGAAADELQELKDAKIAALRLLLDKGADLSLRNNQGQTAADIAAAQENAPALGAIHDAVEQRLQRQRGTAATRQAGLKAAARKRAPGSGAW